MRRVRATCDPALVPHVTPEPPATVVAGFWPLPGEINFVPALSTLHAAGCIVVLPVTLGPGLPLAFRRWQPGAPLLRERFGTWAPLGPFLVPSVLYVPLLAFDRRGGRLGYGGGFYDRTLAALPGARAIGVGFAAQELDEVPMDAYDARLAMVVTECGVIACR